MMEISTINRSFGIFRNGSLYRSSEDVLVWVEAGGLRAFEWFSSVFGLTNLGLWVRGRDITARVEHL